MLASLPKHPKQWERNSGARSIGPFGPALLNSPAAKPRRPVRPNDSNSSRPDPRIIVLFGALGAIVPFIILSLEQDLGPYVGPDHLLTAPGS